MEVHPGRRRHHSVERTRAATHDDLLEALLPACSACSAAALRNECKSGYGLDTATEVKMLRVLESARSRTPLQISSLCGAHSVPRGKRHLRQQTQSSMK